VFNRFGWQFALAPYVYLLSSRYLCQKIIPMQKRFRRNGQFFIIFHHRLAFSLPLFLAPFADVLGTGRARGVSWGRYRFVSIQAKFLDQPSAGMAWSNQAGKLAERLL